MIRRLGTLTKTKRITMSEVEVVTVEPTVVEEVSLDRLESETQAEYNERVPVAVQPVQPSPTTSYLGAAL